MLHSSQITHAGPARALGTGNHDLILSDGNTVPGPQISQASLGSDMLGPVKILAAKSDQSHAGPSHCEDIAIAQ